MAQARAGEAQAVPADATLGGPALAVATVARRLAPLGNRDGLPCTISWYGPARYPPGRPGSEAAVQALCGLMHVHGQDAGRPRRLGLEVASAAAGVLAGHGVLAGLIGRSRGQAISSVQTSVLQAGLFMVTHYIAAATSERDPVPTPTLPAPGPPFPTADGQWFEIETLDPEAWRCFWHGLGAGAADLGRAWTSFRRRYFSGACSLPPGLHEATAAHTVAEAAAVAEACGVSLCRLRGYDEVVVSPGGGAGHPVVEPTAGPAGGPAPDGVASAGAAQAGELPLAGLTVVEATSRMQGPLAGLLLQMLGATVTRVEPPGGDVGRMVPPLAGDTGSFFLCLNRGKRTVEVDLGTPAGRADLFELATGADVFIQNWRPGKAAEWGLDAEDMARRRPGLVYAGATGWGQAEEPRRLVGTDFLVQAYAGLGDGLSPEGEPAFPTRVLLTDFFGALVACEAVLRGLWRREQTGRGCRVRSSLLAGAMAAQAHVLEALASGQEEGRRRGRPVWGPLDRPLQAADGPVVVSVEDDAAFRRLCRLCQVDPDGRPRAVVEELVARRLATAPGGQWEEALTQAGIACAVPASDLAALAADPRLAGLFEPLAAGAVAPASPWVFHR